MKIAVMGAGAVGCFYGGLLARAGHEVVLIGRLRHVDAIRSNGLLMETQSFRGYVTLSAACEASAAEGCELLLCCVKSGDTAQAGAALAPFIAPGTPVLSFQNGVENADRLRMALPGCRVFPVAVYVAAEMAGPGQVRHHGRGELIMGNQPGAQDLAGLFISAGVAVRVAEDVLSVLWEKLILNCAYNALSAITQLPYGILSKGEGIAGVMCDVVSEAQAVAQAEGVRISEDIMEAVRHIAMTMPTQLSSTAQDVALGRRSEIDDLNGHVVRRGAVLGVATPVNRVLHSLVRLIEDRQQGT